DKYIGDAIMAFFGAPVRHDNDAALAVESGLDMLDAIETFNQGQREHNRPEFRTGVGVGFGNVTIGNIGSERKMDYTVMGDMVNLSSRLEGLTKHYGVPMLITGTTAARVHQQFPCRLVDSVTVKGKHMQTKLYTPRRHLTSDQEQAWKHYHAGLKRYYARRFGEAKRYLAAAGKLLPKDPLVALFLRRCEECINNPPPESWTGVVEISEK
ncbi:MAG: adenylate/guanylate cyclase domain-containing protein, partial [Spirochaetota bacterium]